MTKLPWQRRARSSRGQALVEFALVIPLIAVLLVMSLDFGRVFFGWVGVNNAARIGANFAAAHADAWTLPDSPIKQGERLQYAQQLYNDASAVNCSPRPQMVPTPTYIPVPSFTDLTGNGAATDMGDEVTRLRAAHAARELDPGGRCGDRGHLDLPRQGRGRGRGPTDPWLQSERLRHSDTKHQRERQREPHTQSEPVPTAHRQLHRGADLGQ